ncbi:Urease accessory protein ureE [Thalassoporum mexicanum PCC 7367]|uniref:urease accessory protein UreE n=1 Tax=Thalassoporum mexicanum TaxID=3457544 RepID=UPI00029F9A9E|nr:urease accessory protein UreE [Pseudanabaena sp. PCC 7367]AFY68490.1 Urease accessory protein ureE [Pseudanabaena sp. PCC 7367]
MPLLTLVRRIAVDQLDPIENQQQSKPDYHLALDSEERTRSRLKFKSIEGEMLQLQLPRGTVLRDGDLLLSADEQQLVKVIAKPEAVLTITATDRLSLLKAAYHLGNRHVPLELTPHYLRLAPDSVLADMLTKMGLQITAETVTFQPEAGAYGSSHDHHSGRAGKSHAH